MTRNELRPIITFSAKFLLLCLVLAAACGCDHVTRHKALVSILDGYPSLPPVEQLCQEYEERALAACLKQQAVSAPLALSKRSEHLPYQEKRCNDCHQANKGGGDSSDEGLLVKPREELCFLCHKDLLSRPFHHGPAAVGDCLACHLPHDSGNPALLVLPKETLCAKCHSERRLAGRMHDQFVEKGMPCVNCHDPHSGDSSYFLK